METTPNFELMDRTLDYIVEHPEEHVQREWVCGTGQCFAGSALALQGYRLHRDGTDWASRLLKEGHIADLARAELGIDDASAGLLFSGGNTIEDLKQLVDILRVHGRLTVEDLCATRGWDFPL